MENKQQLRMNYISNKKRLPEINEANLTGGQRLPSKTTIDS